MDKKIKITGLCIALAITALTFGNAMTGHGIKGNKNLNSEVLASGSGSDTEGTSRKNKVVVISDFEIKYSKEYKKNGKTCKTFESSYRVDCDNNGYEICNPGNVTSNGEQCIEYD